MSIGRKHKFSVDDLFKLIPEDYERADLVITDEEIKFVCPSGSVYIIKEDGINYIEA